MDISKKNGMHDSRKSETAVQEGGGIQETPARVERESGRYGAPFGANNAAARGKGTSDKGGGLKIRAGMKIGSSPH